jgi:uncharacterized damage-inducible protein DinB
VKPPLRPAVLHLSTSHHRCDEQQLQPSLEEAPFAYGAPSTMSLWKVPTRAVRVRHGRDRTDRGMRPRYSDQRGTPRDSPLYSPGRCLGTWKRRTSCGQPQAAAAFPPDLRTAEARDETPLAKLRCHTRPSARERVLGDSECVVPPQSGVERERTEPSIDVAVLKPVLSAEDHIRLTAGVDTDRELMVKRELLAWLDAQRAHVTEQVRAMPAEARRQSYVPSGWTPRGLVRHLTLDVERVWFRAVMAGERVDLPEGYDGWTAPELQSDEELLEQYADESRLATAAVEKLQLDAEPAWWFEDGGNPPYSCLREVLLHVIVETATHAGHLDICRELADGGQRLVLDEPTT